MLQALGSEIAKVRLIGIETGTPAFIIRQVQSLLVLVSSLSALQQSADGPTPVELLPVIKLIHGVKLETMELVHGVVI